MNSDKHMRNTVNRLRQLIYHGLYSMEIEGIRSTAGKTFNYIGLGGKLSYKRWAEKPLYTTKQLAAQRRHTFDKNIRFSIITPLYNTSEEYLRSMIESVLAQTYSGWELCLGDGCDEQHAYIGSICRGYAEKDMRVRYKKLERNLGIAGNSNACIDMAEGEYIAILDHDDILHPAALHDMMKRICEEQADFIYTDEAVFAGPDVNNIKEIHFKKGFAPDDLLANNYIGHFTAFRRSLLEGCGGFREGFDGSQDHELFLRLTGAAEKISHVPEVLYFRRDHSGPAAEDAGRKLYEGDAGRKAVKGFLDASGIIAKVDNSEKMPAIFRISYEIPREHPKVSIIIPSFDHAGDLRTCVASILEKTTYDNYEVIIIENNSREPETFDYYKTLKSSQDKVKVIIWPGKGFNWSALNNYAVREAASGKYLLLLNNDTEVITPKWIEELMMYAQKPDVGIAGAMLYYPDDTIQHAGVIIGLGGTAGHVSSGSKRGDCGYMNRLLYAQNLSAVTGACMMIRREVFENLGGMDEAFAAGLNDIDFCLRAREAGYRIVWTPYAELYHYESKSRSIYDTREARKRTRREMDMFRKKWAEILEKGDPYYNPNLSLLNQKYEIRKQRSL